MTKELELAKLNGIAYYLTPKNTPEMHGTDRQIQAFAEAVRADERERCAAICDGLTHALDHGGNAYRREAFASQCAAAIRNG